MGLDMFLTKRIYVGAEYEHSKVTGDINIFVNEKPLPINLNKVSYIIESAGYWRKANAIHNWFVENVQDGKDDCGEYYVSTHSMKELLSACKTVLENSKLTDGRMVSHYTFDELGDEVPHYVDGSVIDDSSAAEELLPTASGFFFGDTDYNEYYLSDIKDTIVILEEALKDESAEFYYSASW